LSHFCSGDCSAVIAWVLWDPEGSDICMQGWFHCREEERPLRSDWWRSC